MRRVFVLALSLTILLPLLAVLLVFAAASSQAQCGGAVGPGSAPGVPANLMAIYEQAAGSYQLGPSGWAYLAAINEIETNFGHDLSTSTAGAIGWMQFEPGTWARYAGLGRPRQTRRAAGPRTTRGTRSSPPPATCTPAAPPATGRPRCTPTTTPAGTSPKPDNSPNTTHRPPAPPSRRTARRRAGCVTAGPTTPGPAARILPDGLAAVPQDAPSQVQAAIAAGNRIIDTLLQHRTPAEHAQHRHGLLRLLRLDRLRALQRRPRAAPRSTSATGSPATPPCSKPTAAPAPATGSPSTPPPTTPSSRSPESCSTPPTGHPPPHPAADPAGNPHQPSPTSSPTATRGPNDTPQDYENTPQPTSAEAIAARRRVRARDRIHRHATGHDPDRHAHPCRGGNGPGDRDRRADTQSTQRAERSAARGRGHSRASVRPLPRPSTPRTAAARVHTPSARDRSQQRPAARPPARHPAAAHQPHRRRDSWTAHFAIRDTHGRQTTTAQLVLSRDRRPVEGRRADPARPGHAHHPEPARPAAHRPRRRPPRGARIHRTATSTTPTTIPPPASCTTSPPRCEPRSPPTRPACRQRSAHCTPASQASHSHATAQVAGRRQRHRRTRHLPGHQPPRPVHGEWLSSRCDPQDESAAPTPTTLGHIAKHPIRPLPPKSESDSPTTGAKHIRRSSPASAAPTRSKGRKELMTTTPEGVCLLVAG